MWAYLLTGPEAAKVEGIDVTSLTGPVVGNDPVVYVNINPQSYDDIFKLYHYAIYPHYLSNVPAAYAVTHPNALFKKLKAIPDPPPVSCPLTGEKAARHLAVLPWVRNLEQCQTPEDNTVTCVFKKTHLDPEQQEAALHKNGPALVIAPAGSGKTRTIVTRIQALVKMGIPPERILCLTFTKKAQQEMYERLARKLEKNQSRLVTVKTYHALAYMLLYKLNDQKPEIITDRRPILLNLMADTGCKIEEVDAYISLQLNNLTPPEAVEPSTEKEKQMAEIYLKYQEHLKKSGILDQDNLLYALYERLRDDPKARWFIMDYRPIGERSPVGLWWYVLVDEAQDNNFAQDVLTRFLAAPWDNVYWVGDEDQLLYGFRGSSIDRILNLKQTYPNLREIYLKRNYRCRPAIVKAADTVIRRNRKRREKEIIAARGESGTIEITARAFELMMEEHEWISEEIARLLENGHKPESIAVLYRTNSQGDALGVTLQEKGIPHFVHRSGPSLFDSGEAETLMNHLTVLSGKDDTQAVLSCLRLPFRTDKTVQYARKMPPGTAYALDRLRVLAEDEKDWRVVQFCDDIRTAKLVAGALPNAGQAVKYLRTKFPDLDQHFSDEMLDILQEIATKFDTMESFATWLRRMKAAKSSGKSKNTVTGGIQLMTVHSAKGLEFKTVFLINCTEGYFPHSRSMNDEDGLEEERRIFYVGMTRAKEMLYMTGFKNTDRQLSRFLRESGVEIITEGEM